MIFSLIDFPGRVSLLEAKLLNALDNNKIKFLSYTAFSN